MRKVLALTALIAAAAVAGCGRKTAEKAADAPAPAPAPAPAAAANAPAPAAAAAPLPALPGLSPDACAVLATYVKVELQGDFGLPVVMRVDPAKDKQGVGAAELSKAPGGLKPAEATALAAGLTQSIQNGSQLDCDWKALGLPRPTPQTAESQAFIRFRPVVAGEVAVLETFTDGITQLGGRCLYRKTAGGWTREKCVLTHLS